MTLSIACQKIVRAVARTCSTCETPIGPYNKSGLCKPCVCRRNRASPEINAKRRAGIFTAWDRPGRREAASQAARAVSARPEIIAGRRENGKRNAHRSILGPLCLARKNDPGGRARMAEKLSRLRYAGVPGKWLDDYREIMRKRKMTRAEALQILAERERARLAAMSPFERQMHALKNGARLIEKPVFRSRSYDFTLGGVSSMEGG